MKAHICIGGPLDGEFATTEDFIGYKALNPETGKPYKWSDRDAEGRMPNGLWSWQREPGMYEHLRHEYHRFNSGGTSKVSMVWIHKDTLQMPISPRKR